MAANLEKSSEEYELDSEKKNENCAFEWDDQSQLYFHASSGFYHDPNAGWYYSSRDGSYYKFENGSYVLLESNKGVENDAVQQRTVVPEEAMQNNTCQTCINNDDLEDRPAPSEWLEETLIDLYLTGYCDSVINAADEFVQPSESDGACDSKLLVHAAENDIAHEIEEGERLEEDLEDKTELGEKPSDEGASLDEENWNAQYGQVVQSGDEGVPVSSIIDLWDWEMTTKTVLKKTRRKKKTCQIARLTGRLVQPSTKLHPSMPYGGRLVKTAIICEANLDLVRVSSGKVYRLKTPSLKYLSSLSTYDSSNPSKDWGFPDLSYKEGYHLPKPRESCDNETPAASADTSSFPDQQMLLDKNKGLAYRDRAAERRALHGGFGVGPGQKNSGPDSEMKTPRVSDSTGEAAAEALHMSFGAGSYARRVLENMGWKEGEALGKSTKGLLQPLEAVGNKGLAGLGWNQCRPDNR
ncbi:G-patch domain-containing protein [Thalictrum thalictroides]|uniref:G-patch domain-containing protein n=1 Tax=Thalictrum thalictroides TaxID=46969 RepID=A0A7J6XG37_THATH|nr:G-patch domain-containing protein [Thalictrum thalictroides]